MKSVNFSLRNSSALYTGLIGTAILAIMSQAALADPTGGQVVGGTAIISSSGNQTTINQLTQRALIDWNTFNVGSNETVRFNQISSGAVALNRVMDSGVSTIDGQILANGNVWILNPDGVVFGNHSRVNVGGLLATSSNIRNSDFMAGNYNFTIPGHTGATITNNGSITAADAGLVGFVAPNVVNNGTIRARLGKVQMYSGDTFTVDLHGDGLINLQASPTIVPRILANHGSIIADGGTVTLSAAAAGSVVNNLINLDGLIQADNLNGHTGNVNINTPGNVSVTGGKITAGGKLAVNNGGTFNSTVAGVLNGDIVQLNQNIGGSIQNAIDAVGKSNHSTLTLGNGYFTEQVAINKSNFTLNGQGVNQTRIQAPVSTTPSVPDTSATLAINNANNVTVSNLSIDGNHAANNGMNAGIKATNSNNLTLANDTVYDFYQGISVIGSKGGNITNNGLFGNGIGLSISQSSGVNADNNHIGSYVGTYNTFVSSGILEPLPGSSPIFGPIEYSIFQMHPTIGINVDNSSNVALTNNTITGGITGISMYANQNSRVTSNVINANNTSFLSYSPTNGIVASAESNSVISNNMIGSVGNGITTYNSGGLQLTGNYIASVGDGIHIYAGHDVTLLGNSVLGISSDPFVSSSGVGGNATNGNSGTGIILTDVAGKNTIGSSGYTSTPVAGTSVKLISPNGNTVRGYTNGISITGGSNTSIANNKIYGVTNNNTTSPGKGIELENSTHATITGNAVSDFANGILLSSSNNVTISKNTVTGSDSAVQADNSSNITIAGNTLTGFSGGINIFSDQNVSITGNSLTGKASISNPDGSGSSSTDIVITDLGDGNGRNKNVSIVGNTFNNVGAGIFAINTDGFTFKGNSLTADATYPYGTGLFMSDVNGATIDSNSFKGLGSAIYGGEVNNLTLTNNTINDSVSAVLLSAATNATITGNQILRTNSGIDIETGQAGSIVIGSNGPILDFHAVPSSNVTISGNTITSAQAGNGTGIKLGSGTINSTVAKNTVSNFDTAINIGDNAIAYNPTNDSNTSVTGNTIKNATTGINVANSDHVTIASNTLTGIKGDGIVVTGAPTVTYTTVPPACDSLLGCLTIGVGGFGPTQPIGGGPIITPGPVMYPVYGPSDTHDISITGNSITAAPGNSGSGIVFNNVANSTIGGSKKTLGNTVSGFDTGIKIGSGSTNINASNNTISKANNGMEIADSDHIGITGNTFTGITGNGVYAHGISLIGGGIFGGGGPLIAGPSDAHDINILDNSFTANAAYNTVGINIVNAFNVVNHGNRFTAFDTQQSITNAMQ